MKPWMRWSLTILGVLVIGGAGAYYWLFLDNRMPATGSFALDIEELRKLAQSMPGDRPSEIRALRVSTFRFPGAAVMTGQGWSGVDMPVQSYQLVYPYGTAIIDTALDSPTATGAAGSWVASYDEPAYAQMNEALDKASLIIVTHEHADHLGGLATGPHLAERLKAARLTVEQIDHLDRTKPAEFPPGALSEYQPLHYDGLLAIAPGMVLIKAPGHTPGSQMVFVQRADGAEYLFLGDVAWSLRNVENLRERARLMTNTIKEDRDAVMLQLAAIKRLHEAEPKLAIVPGHDAAQFAALEKAGLLVPGLKTE